MSGHSAVSQKSVVDQTETLLQKPFPLFSEEVNAHLEQLNETVYHNDPFLVAFTLTTDPSRQKVNQLNLWLERQLKMAKHEALQADAIDLELEDRAGRTAGTQTLPCNHGQR